MKEYKYKAFISYSHADEQFASWLHKKLESYKIPKDLLEKNPNLFKKLYPIFRDREELPTSASLSSNIDDALQNSAYLIVICSPNSAKSYWVNQEIIEYKTLHKDGEDRILPIIIDGEPNAKDKDGFDDNLECFPEALKYKVKDGKLTNERTEPIAADAREGKDGKKFALLKLIAGLLNVGFEELFKREERRRRKRIIFFTIVSLSLIFIFAMLSFYSYKQKNIALKNEQKAKEQLLRANHNLGVAMVEKAKNLLKKNMLLKANLLAYNSLLLLDPKQDSSYKISEAKNIIYNNWPYFINTATLLAKNPIKKVYLLDKNHALLYYDKEIKILDIKSKRVVFNLKREKIESIAKSKDKIAIYGNKLIEILDTNSKKIVSKIKTPKSLTAIALSNNRLIGALFGGELYIWDINSKNIIKKLQAHSSYIGVIATAPNNNLFATGSNDKSIKIWDSKSFNLLYTLKEKSALKSLTFSPNSLKLASTTGAKNIKVWSMKSAELLQTLKGHTASVNSVAFFEDNIRLISGAGELFEQDPTIKIWDSVTGELIQTINAYKKVISGVDSLSLYKDRLVTISYNSFKVWQRDKNLVLKVFRGERKAINDVLVFNKKVVAGSKGSVKIWDINSTKLLANIKIDGTVTSLNLDKKENLIVSTSNFLDFNTLKVIDLNQAKVIKRCKDSTTIEYDAIYLPTINKVATSSDEKLVKIWDIKNCKIEKNLKGHKQKVTSLLSLPKGKLASASVDRTIKIWDIKRAKELNSLSGFNSIINSIAYIPSKNELIAGCDDNKIKVWDFKKNKITKVLSLHTNYINSVAVNNKALLSASGDKSIIMWNIDNFKPTNILKGHKAGVNRAIFFKSSVVSASDDKTVRVWDIKKLNNKKFIKSMIKKYEDILKLKVNGIEFKPLK